MTNFENINTKLCNKCGTCVGVCPTNALNATINCIEYSKDKCISCSKCYVNCPGINFNYNEMNSFLFKEGFKNKLTVKEELKEEINQIGLFKSTHIAQAKDNFLKNNSSSGGAVTSILNEAFERKLIDGAIVVGMSNEKPWLYQAKIVKSIEEITNTRGSKYTIVSLNSILKESKNFKGKLAFVGLPCHIHGIRKLQKNNPETVKNIVVVLGIFCGFNVSFDATQFLIEKQGIKLNDILKLEYRGGKWPGGLLITTKNKNEINANNNKQMYNKQMYNKQYFLPKYYYDITDTMFIPKRCLICVDYMNDFADISFGDIWLNELNREPWSAMIIRTKKGKDFIAKTQSCLNIKSLSVKNLIKSHEHNIKHKKIGSLLRMNSKEEKMIFGIDALTNSTKDNYKVRIESLIFYIFGSKLFHLFANIIPLTVLGYAAKIRRKLVKKTI